ncbi:MAG: hypothetical protein ACM3QS_15655 [Bacteroidota bacterium]
MADPKTRAHAGNWRLPFGLFAGPALWVLQILIGYGLASAACTTGNTLPVYAIILLSGLVVLAVAILVYREWNSRQDGSPLAAANQAQESPTFWAVSGLFVSAFFFLLILATGVTALFLSPCPVISMPLP